MKNSIKIQRYIAYAIIGIAIIGFFVLMGTVLFRDVGAKCGFWPGLLAAFIPPVSLALIIWCIYAIARGDE